jgi:hypothetical protein
MLLTASFGGEAQSMIVDKQARRPRRVALAQRKRTLTQVRRRRLRAVGRPTRIVDRPAARR